MPTAVLLVIASLYFGKDVLMPLAVLLSFVLAPIMTLLESFSACVRSAWCSRLGGGWATTLLSHQVAGIPAESSGKDHIRVEALGKGFGLEFSNGSRT
jgi:hypothetical protein